VHFAKPLTQNMKAKATPIVLERDYNNEEPWCIFCELLFVFNHKHWRQVWEHLNNNDDDHRVENLAWAHSICNEQKKNNTDYQIIAREKFISNIKWVQQSDPTRKREGENNLHTDTEELTDAEVGKIIDKTTQKFLDERLKGPEPKYCLSRLDTRSCIVFLVKKETNGRGSPQAVDRAIDTYCCTIADYISKKEDGKRIIRLRKQEEEIF